MSAVIAGLGRNWWLLVLYGVIAVLFGLGAIVWPGKTAIAIAWAFGVMALAEGTISVLALFRSDVSISKVWLALYALVSICFGVLAVTRPVAMVGALLFLLAAWLIVAGIYRIVFAIRVRKLVDREWLIALSGLLAIALGVLFVAYPARALVTVALWIGVLALFYGVLQIVAGFRLRKLSQAV